MRTSQAKMGFCPEYWLQTGPQGALEHELNQSDSIVRQGGQVYIPAFLSVVD